MTKKNYVVSSPEGANFARDGETGIAPDEGTTVTLELPEETETALLAAGWLEHDKKPKEAKQ